MRVERRTPILRNPRVLALACAAALTLGGCERSDEAPGGQSRAEITWARAALERNPNLEVVAVDAETGVFTDGWMGAESAYNQYASPSGQGGSMVVRLGRWAWGGPDKPGRVLIRVGTLVKGADKQQVGQVAAEIRRRRPPEPYKGKGIRYQGEVVRRKAGKAFAGGAAS